MNATQELLFYDRYESRLKREGIYGEKPLRWAYETMLGRLCLEGVIKRRWFSRLYGRWADTAGSAKEIAPSPPPRAPPPTASSRPPCSRRRRRRQRWTGNQAAATEKEERRG
ncbi:MAG: hypothetical protein NWQ95_03655, partial [Verrucomicrobiales bacterium]|nr:hypothetical protein [Verrucomicrobiales bacterium]